MNSKRLYFLLIGVLVLALAGLVGGAYGINSLLTKQSRRLVSLKAQSQALTQEQTNLARAKRDIATYASLETIAKSVVPQDKDQAEAVREIVNIAAASKVTLGSITFPSSTLGGSVAPTTTPSAAAKTPAASTSKTSLSQLTAVPNIPGVYSLPITVTNSSDNPVTYTALYNFLARLENNRRTAQVSTLSIQPLAAAPGQLTFTITINEYIKP